MRRGGVLWLSRRRVRHPQRRLNSGAPPGRDSKKMAAPVATQKTDEVPPATVDAGASAVRDGETTAATVAARKADETSVAAVDAVKPSMR